jgi:hypothetical protein
LKTASVIPLFLLVNTFPGLEGNLFKKASWKQLTRFKRNSCKSWTFATPMRRK